MSSWLVSKKTYTLFSYSAWVVIFIMIFMIFLLTPFFHQIDAVAKGDIFLRIFGGVLGFVGAPASLIIFLGMTIFCVREDRSSVGTKMLWFIFFFVTAWFGSVVYFFSVYRKRVGRMAQV